MRVMAETLRINTITEELKDITISGFKIEPTGKEIGRGAYGRVFTVKYCGWVCAAKEIHSILLECVGRQEQQRIKESFIRECYHCSVLSHPNIVRFIGVYYPNSDLNIPVMIMELMDESLTAYIKTLPINELIKKSSILLDVVEGLSYLHAQNPPVIHRDLSPNNILLQKSGGKNEIPVAKIADLGVANVVKTDRRSTMHKLTKVPGTVDFMPPEAFASTPVYGTGLDVFSYGNIMLFVATHKWPTPMDQVKFDPKTDELIPLSEVQRREEYLNEIRGDVAHYKPLIISCLHNNPTKRPTITDVSKRLKELSPFVLALQSDYYKLTWEKCADLPSPLYYASVALHDNKVYAMAGDAPDLDTLHYVYVYDINSNQWDKLPSPGQFKSTVQIINAKLTVLGGRDSITKNVTNKVVTFNNNRWINHYPNMQKARLQPGVVMHVKYIIAAGGILHDETYSDSIEVFNWRQSSHWTIAMMKLPKPMWAPSLTIANNLLYVLGYICMHGYSYKVYQIPVGTILSETQTFTSYQTYKWNNFLAVPHGYSAVIPNSCPPVIVGGSKKGIHASEISVLDILNTSWKKIASLATAKAATAVVPVNYDSILVIGGYTGGRGVEGALIHSITTVEKGTVRLYHPQ